NPTVGLAAHAGQVDVRITAKASSESVADQMIAEIEAILHGRIGPYVFGYDDEQIEDVFARLLADHDANVAVLQVGVGDIIAQRIKKSQSGQVLKSSESYSTLAELTSKLSVGSETGLRDLAEKAATTICHDNETTLGIAVVSNPDMGENHADDEAGTAIAVYFSSGQMRSRIYGFGSQSETAPIWTTTWALSIAWRMLKEAFGE
ncbi:MAG: hypothetical protein K8I82_17785, partial [Anaerolineae bacterium]|nr:hypothetical protein [Anaerolineae bacterium]